LKTSSLSQVLQALQSQSSNLSTELKSAFRQQLSLRQDLDTFGSRFEQYLARTDSIEGEIEKLVSHLADLEQRTGR
jgi:uncharacterized coiled-coil DUF342 family protein